jgi:non-specific serine/threonine protein kinase/serine/threonine-protein kinase
MVEGLFQRARAVFDGALALDPAARAAFLEQACGGDTELRREVDSLLEANEQARGFLSGPAALPGEEEPAAPARPIGPYRVLGVIARGGMGTVYRAVRDDDTFRKTVALKLVRASAASAEIERRFRQERQILGRLQHPNIAAILDGGATEEGQPYLVMEYVEGSPITAYCDAHGLGPRERLGLFASVCDAVEYAHRNLVVHRDLKPDNILVTADGIPKLLDFGIAKLLAAGVDPDAAPTATMLPMMTPDYASPEQVKGEPITTATDVYSLGVLLYELLAGRKPYVVKSDSMEEIVRAVCVTEPPPPSSTVSAAGRAALKGDLDTIVMKAMRKEPDRRYSSAQALGDDLRRHLEGRPVLARPDTVRYRASKFVRRNRGLVAAVALVMAALVGGLAAATRQARIAERERALAQRRFQDVRRLANSFVFEFHDAIRDLPGSTPARRLVVAKGLEYLDGLAAEAHSDPALQAELAAAYEKVGEVQGSPLAANLGDTAGAMASYRKEVAIRETLYAARPDDREIAARLAGAYRRLGLVEDEAGATREGARHVAKSLALAEELAAAAPDDRAARALLASAHDSAGLLALKGGDHAGAERHQRVALEGWRALLQPPADAAAPHGLIGALGALARTLRVTGRTAEAADHYRLALSAARDRLRQAPDDAVARRDASTANTNLAVALYSQEKHAEAERHMRESLALDEAALRADPRNSQAQRDVSWDLGFLAELAIQMGRLPEALDWQGRSLAMNEARAAASPDSFQAKKDAAEDHSALSDLYFRLRRHDAALASSRTAIARFEELGRANPAQKRLQQLLAAQYARQAAILRALGRDACAEAVKSRDLWSEIAAAGAAIDTEHAAARKEVAAVAQRCPAR